MGLVAYRHSDWPQPFPPFVPGQEGRYHRVGGHIANYWSLHPHGPWAEWLRSSGVKDEHAARQLRGRTWAAIFDVDFTTINFDNAEDWGLIAADLVSDDQTRCRDLAEELVGQGVVAARVPSAALPGTENLIVFGQRTPSPYLAVVVDPLIDVPCAATAEDGRPADQLLGLVRHYGQPHAALEAWAVGDTYAYPQP